MLLGGHVSCHALWNHYVPCYLYTILQVLHLVRPSGRHMHHLAMVLVECLNICTPGFRVFAQELAEFGNISLAEEGVKHVTSILGALVKALLTVIDFFWCIIVGGDDAAGIDKNPSGHSCPLLNLQEAVCLIAKSQRQLITTCMS